MGQIFEIASVLAAAAFLFNIKIMNIFKPKTKAMKYFVSATVGSATVLLARLAGPEFDLPDLAVLSWTQLGIVDVIVMVAAGGGWDLLKYVGIRKPV